MSLIGFPKMEKVTPDFEKHFHDCFQVGNNLIAGRFGACWRLYTNEGYPLTRKSHTLRMESFGKIVSELGASEVEYDLHDLMDDYNGIKNLIKAMIKEQTMGDKITI